MTKFQKTFSYWFFLSIGCTVLPTIDTLKAVFLMALALHIEAGLFFSG
ncbi:MAG: hypothetical protein ACJA2G_000492 [Cognaticolwellia sp.]|jgi:hypothetical protein